MSKLHILEELQHLGVTGPSSVEPRPSSLEEDVENRFVRFNDACAGLVEAIQTLNESLAAVTEVLYEEYEDDEDDEDDYKDKKKDKDKDKDEDKDDD